MSLTSSRVRQLKKAREAQAKKLEAKKNDKKRKINEVINEIYETNLDLNLVTKLPKLSKEQTQLIFSVQQLSEEELNVHNKSQIQPFKKKLKSIFQANKREYASNTIWLATSISQIGQISLRSTVECMQQDISTLHTNAQIHQAIMAPSFGVLVDKST
ncbi:11390_t:CDS:2 [Funneliformis mosseae]|uniref:11390_t:CDS:1 n=1 Tax=Funneliformis mosseae TaxID=27381 RepID=A0A9N9FIP8_FUNMO|nr:11390_t:CDS:2 [Funneliformis mosseae]